MASCGINVSCWRADENLSESNFRLSNSALRLLLGAPRIPRYFVGSLTGLNLIVMVLHGQSLDAGGSSISSCSMNIWRSRVNIQSLVGARNILRRYL